MAIARKLLGPLADQYGDVIGARPRTLQDVGRDMSIGASAALKKGDAAGAVRTLHARVLQEYQKAANQASEDAARKQQMDRAVVSGSVEIVKTAQTLPPKYRTGFLKEEFGKLGIEPSPTVLKMAADSEQLGQTFVGALVDHASTGDMTADDMTNLMGSPKNMADFLNQASQIDRNRQATANMVIDQARTKLSIKQAQMDYLHKLNDEDRQKKLEAIELHQKKLNVKATDERIHKARKGSAKEQLSAATTTILQGLGGEGGIASPPGAAAAATPSAGGPAAPGAPAAPLPPTGAPLALTPGGNRFSVVGE